MSIFQFILTLPAATISGGGWANTYFSAIREKALAHSGAVTTLAMSLACIFIAFLFIKMYYDFVSDEQNGGFGGVKAWDILRPLVILICISSFSWFAGLFDSVCDSVSSSLVANMNASLVQSDEALQKKLDELEAQSKAERLSIKEQALEMAIASSGTNKDDYTKNKETKEKIDEQVDNALQIKWYHKLQKMFLSMPADSQSGYVPQAQLDVVSDITSTDIDKRREKMRELGLEEEYLLAKAEVANVDNLAREAEKRLKERKRWMKYLGITGSGGGIVASAAGTLFNIFFVIMMALADIMLCVLIVFGPLTLALSIIPQWKDAFIKWMGTYVEVSLWKPIGSAIAWTVITAKAAIAENQINALAQSMNLGNEAAQGTIIGSIGAQALLLIAGVFALLQTASIASAVLNLGGGSLSQVSGGMMSSIGGFVGAKAGAAAGKGAKAAGTMAGSTIKGAAQGVKQGVGVGFGARVGALDGISKLRGGGGDAQKLAKISKILNS